jgi:hypothetical protein
MHGLLLARRERVEGLLTVEIEARANVGHVAKPRRQVGDILVPLGPSEVVRVFRELITVGKCEHHPRGRRRRAFR